MHVCVVGWYGHGNIGDEAFKESFLDLWPDVTFTFRDQPPDPAEPFDAIWIGGGSFLDQQLRGINDLTAPLGFIGIGIGSAIHRDNVAALQRAKVVVVRDQASKDRWPASLVAPDLVFAREPLPDHRSRPQQVTVLLNDFMTPRGGAYEWQATSYNWFCQEFAKVCDILVDRGFTLKFLPMGVSHEIDDRRIAAAVIGRMRRRATVVWCLEPPSELDLRREIKASRFTITQRYHGLVYSVIEQRPAVVLAAHDKLTGLLDDLGWQRGGVDYYGLTDQRFFHAMEFALSAPRSSYGALARERWRCISDTVTARFCS